FFHITITPRKPPVSSGSSVAETRIPRSDVETVARYDGRRGAQSMDAHGRREFLVGTAAWGAALVSGALGAAPAGAAEEKPRRSADFPMPGPFRGKVVEVAHPGAVANGAVNADAVGEVM